MHYVVIRRDLPFGAQVAQVVHAAGESAALLGSLLPDGTHAVALWIETETALRSLADRLTAEGIQHILIEECECGPPSTASFAGQATAIGIKPLPMSERSRLRKVLSSLPLVGKDKGRSHGEPSGAICAKEGGSA